MPCEEALSEYLLNEVMLLVCRHKGKQYHPELKQTNKTRSKKLPNKLPLTTHVFSPTPCLLLAQASVGASRLFGRGFWQLRKAALAAEVIG